MADNVLGSVQIVITGDTSQLQAAFARAESIAATSGVRVSQAFSRGADGADKVVFAIGRLAGVVEQQSAAMSLAFQRNIANLAGLGSATAAVTTSTEVATVAQRAHGEAMAGSVNQARLLGSELRVLEGQQGILTAERFLATIPGVTALSGALFPLFGALAIGEIAFRGISAAMKDTSEAAKNLSEVLAKDTEEWELLSGQLEKTNIERITSQLGKAQGLHLKGFYDEATAKRDQIEIENTLRQITAAQKVLADTKGLYSDNPFVATLQAFNPLITGMRLASGSMSDQAKNIAALQDKYGTLTEALRVFDNEQRKTTEDTKRATAEQSGALAAINATNTEKAAVRAQEANIKSAEAGIQAAHRVRQARIDAEDDAGNREIANAEEAKRVAQDTASAVIPFHNKIRDAKIEAINARAAGESAGKPQSQQTEIEARRVGEVAAAKDEATQKSIELVRKADDEEDKIGAAQATAGRGWAAEVDQAWAQGQNARRERQARIGEEAAKLYIQEIDGAIRVKEIEEKSAGEAGALGIKAKQIALEGEYGARISHTFGQEIEYMRQIAALEHAERQAKIDGLEAELKTAEALDVQLRDLVKIATLRAEIAKLSAEDTTASAAAANKAKDAEAHKTLAGQVAGKLPQGSIVEQSTAIAANTVVSAVDGISGALAKAVVQGKSLSKTFADLGKQLALSAATSILKAGLSAVVNVLIGMVPAFTAVSGAAAAAAAAQKAAAEANVLTAAGEAAAWAFESVMAALPFPVNVAVAPAVAAETFAQTVALGSFDKGGPIDHDQIAKVHSGEWVLTADQVQGRAPMPVLPGMAQAAASGGGFHSQSFNTGSTNMSFHAHGMTNPDQFIDTVMRRLPERLKLKSSGYSPGSH